MSSVKCLDFSHHHLVDVPPDVFQYERTLEELHLNANRVSHRCQLWGEVSGIPYGIVRLKLYSIADMRTTQTIVLLSGA